MTNSKIFNLIREYGIVIVIAIAVVWWSLSFMKSTLAVAPYRHCDITLESGSKMWVNDEEYVVSDFNHFDSLGKMYVEFRRSNN